MGVWHSGLRSGWRYKLGSHLHFGGMKAQGEITEARSTDGNGGLGAWAGRPMRRVHHNLGER